MKEPVAVTRQQVERYIKVNKMGDSLYGTLRVRVERGGKTNIRTFRTKITEEQNEAEAKRILSRKMVSFLRTKRRSYTNIRPIRGE